MSIFDKIIGICFPGKCALQKLKNLKRVYCCRGSRINGSTFAGRNAVHKNAKVIGCSIGKGAYIGENSNLYKVITGRFCSIANNVQIGVGTHPSSIYATTHPSFYYDTTGQLSYSYYKEKQNLYEPFTYVEDNKNFTVQIGNDVWIGCNAIIMSGVKIGDGAIVAAGAIVTRDVPAYSIVGGIPAKTIRNRFNNDQIEFLLKFQWWNKDDGWLTENCQLLSDVKRLMEYYDNIK